MSYYYKIQGCFDQFNKNSNNILKKKKKTRIVTKNLCCYFDHNFN